MAITKDQIFAVADELDSVGKNPTLAAVRKQLGGGSFTTISEAMNEWRARRTAQIAPTREPAPQAIMEKLVVFGGELWALAMEMANNRLAAEREALESARQEMEETRQEVAELADQLASELDEAKGRIVALQAADVAARGEVDELRGKLAASSERVATAEARANELRIELDHAHQEAHQVRDERDVVRIELVKVQTKAEMLTVAQRERDQAREEAAVLRARVDALENVIAKGQN